MPMTASLFAIAIVSLLMIAAVLLSTSQKKSMQKIHDAVSDSLHSLHTKLLEQLHRQQMESLQSTQQVLSEHINQLRTHIVDTLKENNEVTGKRVDKLTQDVDNRLKDISGQVERRLNEGFEKTNATFVDVVKRLALIDEAQKQISQLSNNVVDLQSILSDKKSRGAFGEVQLSALVRNLLPEANVSFQHTLSNGKRVDCMLFLPEPTGNVAIDAKFPLEAYRKLSDPQLRDLERAAVETQFRNDIRKHIQDVASKYIIADETSDGAVLFIPAEAVFAEIHAHYPELVEEAHRQRVWLVSPTTLMAILTTAKAVLKDAATRKQIHIIQEHLIHLSQDFDRFQKRMDNLARHIKQANDDVSDVNSSAKKITSRFAKIEHVELEDSTLKSPLLESLND